MQRRDVLAGLAGLAATSAAQPAGAYEYPTMTRAGPGWQVGVSPNSWKRIYANQQQSNWCWAASLEMLFAAAGRKVSQQRIVATCYGGLVNLPAFSARQIAALTNVNWVDDYGQPFAVRLIAAYDYFAGVLAINDIQILAALRAEQPMIVCNRSHAMLAMSATYVQRPGRLEIVDFGVFDPWPGRGLRGEDRPREFLAAHLGGEMTYLGLAVVG